MADKNKPLTLSIIIPAYNEERHLRRCLESVAAQKIKPDEVIVVDNNSSDTTADIARSLPFVTVIQEKKQGIVHARNAGFNASTSDIIARIDADTILPKAWTKKVLEFYSNNHHKNHALTGGGYFYNVHFPPRKVVGWVLSQIAFRFNRFLMGHYILWGSNMAITRGQWQAVQGLLCIRTDIHEDLDLAIHLHRLDYEISYRARLKVGVEMKRVFYDRSALYANMLWWPRTLRAHGNWRWVMGWLGAQGLYIGSYPLWLLNKPLQWMRNK